MKKKNRKEKQITRILLNDIITLEINNFKQLMFLSLLSSIFALTIMLMVKMMIMVSIVMLTLTVNLREDQAFSPI